MKRAINSLPIQKLSFNKKNDDWKEDCVDYIVSVADMDTSQELPSDQEIQSNYDLYNSLYDEKELKYVTNPFGQEDGFPAMAQDYNIIRPKIDLLVGEETKRPFNFKVCRTSDIASGEVLDKAKQLLYDYVQAYMASKLSQENAERYQEALRTGEILSPEQIHAYITRDYKDEAEMTAYHTLRYFTEKLNAQHEFNKGWKDVLCAALEYYYVGVLNNEPCLEVVNPKEFKFANGENIEFVHEAEWCCRRMNLTVAQIYDRLYDKLEEKDLNELLEMVEQHTSGTNGFGRMKGNKKDDFTHMNLKFYNKKPDHNPFSWSNDEVVVYHVCWRSYKKIGFVTYIDPETESIEELQVDEFYKPNGSELNVEWKWIVEIWEGYRLGDNKYVGVQPIEYQYINSDLNSQRLPYTGAVYSNRNSQAKSLVSIMKPLQYMYIILWYRLELAIARDKGKVINMDITQIPKSLGIDVSKWMHYISSLGVNFINPYEEGWDIPGREGGKPSGFNQMSAQDLSMSNTIASYIELMSKIEVMAGEISGISAQRQGAISSNELVGNVERSVIQSAHITEPLFWMHNQVKKEVLKMLLNTAKHIFKTTDKQYIHYILDDTTRAFLTVSEDFPYEDFDIFVTDSTKENLAIEQIRQLVQPAMQNGASLMDIIDILTIDNVSMLKNKMEEVESARQEREQAMFEREQETQIQLQQMSDEVAEQQLLIDQAKLDLEKYKIDVDNATRITVAELQAYRGAKDMDQDGNGVPDPMEIADAALAQQKLNAELSQKQMDAVQKAREADSKNRIEQAKVKAQERAEKNKAVIEKRKLALEEKKLKAQEKLQRIKDQEAYKRELLKARTALKNKTVGEK